MMLSLASIPFPDFDPVVVRFGPLAVHWYGLAYLAGFLLAYWVLRWTIRRGWLRVTYQEMSDLLGWLIAGVIAGGRIGWWLIYHRGTAETWYEPIAIWHGGMSFHGALAGVAAVLAVWSRRRYASFLNLADNLALVAPIGLFLGRLANFVNAELVGRPTNMPWGIIFPGESVPRHPSQLYEALLEGPVLFASLWLARRWAKQRDGGSTAIFLCLYSLFRFAVEFTRQPDEQVGFIAFGWLTMGQLLSLLLLLLGLMLVMQWRKESQDLLNLEPPASRSS